MNTFCRNFIRLAVCMLFAAFARAAVAQPGEQIVQIYTAYADAGIQPTADVARMIVQLEDSSAVRRESAYDSLLKMGPAIQPQLRWAWQTMHSGNVASEQRTQDVYRPFRGQFQVGPATVQPRYAEHALAVLIDRLEDDRRLHPPPISLHFSHALFTDVLADLGRQEKASVSIRLGYGYENPDWTKDLRISVSVNQGTFWQALTAVLQGLPKRRLSSENFRGTLFVGDIRVGLDCQEDCTYGPPPPGTVVSGPLRISPLRAYAPHTNPPVAAEALMLRAAGEPILTNAREIARLDIKRASDANGEPLLPSGASSTTISPLRENYGFEWERGAYGEPLVWHLPVTLANAARVRSLAGTFSIAVAPQSESPLAMPGLETLLLQKDSSPEPEIYLQTHCGVLATPDLVKPPYRSQKEVCDVSDWSRRSVGPTNTDPNKYEILERTFTLRNSRPVPVRFVLEYEFNHKQIDSTLKPVAVVPGGFPDDQRHAIFSVSAKPNEVLNVRIGERTLIGEPDTTNPPFPVLPPQTFSSRAGLSVEFDGLMLTVHTMERTVAGYMLHGELAGPTGTPPFVTPVHHDLGNWRWNDFFLALSVVDRARWRIGGHLEYGDVRHEAARDVVQWTFSTNEPGRVPSTLLWGSPGATRWLPVPFAIN